MADNTSYYQDLLKLSKEIPSLYEKQIDKDIRRTVNDNLKNNEELKIKMKNVLMCYSIRNSSIGYCQGFNFLVLRLLEVLKGEVIIYIFLIKIFFIFYLIGRYFLFFI